MGQFQPNKITDFLGTGLSYPIELENGKPVVSKGKALITSSIKTILSWVLGTRFFLGEFGTRIYDLLEEPNDTVANDLLEAFIKEGLTKWEKRITVSGVKVSQTENNKLATIIYSINGLPGLETFIWPIYSEIKY